MSEREATTVLDDALLDPDLAALLDSLGPLRSTTFETMTPAAARADAMARTRPSGPELAVVRDLPVQTRVGTVPTRLYAPDDRPRPVVMYLHGGGWVAGSIETSDAIARLLARDLGALIISVDYPLAPEHPFPAGLDTSMEVLEWLSEHAADVGGLVGPVAVAGDSAGGNLAAAVAQRARDHGCPPISWQLLLYPILDCDLGTSSYLARATGYGLTSASMAWFWDHYVPDPAGREAAEASPLRAASLVGLPPAVVVTAGFDPLRDEGRSYAHRLREAMVPTVLLDFPTLNHGFLGVVELVPAARRAYEEVVMATKQLTGRR